ncbi:VOC family protein [Zhongshania guokunii]|uniref:VOC family protein n=1 Tax=Zhongshania guokunii TaxID=641783 RepID=A0ABV3UAC5_9GAMM
MSTTSSTEQATKIIPSFMAHVVFQTKHYEEMIEWYSKVFFATPVFSSEILTFMTYDDEHHRFAMFRMPEHETASGPRAGVAHLAYSYGSLSDLLNTYDRLKGLGITPTWAINHGLTTSLYYTDPDGNEIELQKDNFPTPETSKAYFSSPAYLRNPIGAPFDAETLLGGFRRGEEFDQMMKDALAAADPKALPML